MSMIALSPEYQSFRSSLTKQRITIEGDCVWTVYDTGPATVRCPLVFIPPLSGTAEVYFKQLLALSGKGIRVLSIEGPVCWSENRWCVSLRHLLDHLNLDRVHIFGAALGGYLAQKFAEATFRSPRVASLILCNTFSDTSGFSKGVVPSVFYFMPAFALKRHVLSSFPSTSQNAGIADSIDFMVEQLESCERSALAARLVVGCTKNYVEPQRLRNTPITLIDVFDRPGASQEIQENLAKCYPEAKRAHLKTGGNFPYLACANDVNLYILIHLQQFSGERYSPYVAGCEPLTG